MVRFSQFGALSGVLMVLTCAIAGQAATPKTAYDMLPNSVQAVFWIPNADIALAKWEQTQLAQLAADPQVRSFWDSQRDDIEQRLTDAGWRLKIRPRELKNIANGQIALAWLDRPEDTLKPYAVALIVDVAGRKKQTDQLLQGLDAELKQRKAVSQQLKYKGHAITLYKMPKQPGELRVQETNYAVVADQLLAADDLKTLQNLIDAAQDADASSTSLSKDTTFVKGRKQLQISGKAHAEYFVRPLGFARVIRAISGKRTNSSMDILTALQNQGFSSIQCVCGEIEFSPQEFDLTHRGFVLAPIPLAKSAQILDFPNEVKREIPSWVSPNVSTILTTCWNVKTAFWKAEGLVDDIVGTEGVFREVIKGIKLDSAGPQIDIEKEVMPLLTNDIYAITDCKEPITTDSRRNLIALRIADSKKMKLVLDKAMKNEPDAEEVKFAGHSIWKVSHQTDESVTALSLDGFDQFGKSPSKAAGDDEEPLLSNWAITVHNDYLMFASHVEMIEEALELVKEGATLSPLTSQADFQRAQTAIKAQFGDQDASFWQIIRGDRSYRMQYELFREGKLQQSQSMLSTILDKLLQDQTELKSVRPPVNGQALPPFDKISKYLHPSGSMLRTTPHGWSFGSMLLAAPKTSALDLQVNQKAPDTARGGDLILAPKNR